MEQKVTIVFKDQGQDFLEWDLEFDNGVCHPYAPVEPSYLVVACRPFQEDIWKGTRVHVKNQSLGPGILLDITTPGKERRRTKIVHPVEAVKVRNETEDGSIHNFDSLYS